MTDRTDSPTWEELDAICKGKSAMDLAEEIWRLRRNGPQDRKDAERYRWLRSAGWFDDAIMERYHINELFPETIDRAIDDQSDATRENK